MRHHLHLALGLLVIGYVIGFLMFHEDKPACTCVEMPAPKAAP